MSGDGDPDASERPPGFVTQARRRQIIDCTIDLVADSGFAHASLGNIAARAGISKAAVLYHFSSKDNVVQAALMDVFSRLAAAVGALVDAAEDPSGMLVAYIHGLLEHLREHPSHVRVITEVMGQPVAGGDGVAVPQTDSRWQDVAAILDAGQRQGQFRSFDTKVMALAIGGALDAVVGRWLVDPELDLRAASAELGSAVLRAVRHPDRPPVTGSAGA